MPSHQLDDAVERWIDSMLANGPRAMRIQKRLIAHWEDSAMSERLPPASQPFTDTYATTNHSA